MLEVSRAACDREGVYFISHRPHHSRVAAFNLAFCYTSGLSPPCHSTSNSFPPRCLPLQSSYHLIINPSYPAYLPNPAITFSALPQLAYLSNAPIIFSAPPTPHTTLPAPLYPLLLPAIPSCSSLFPFLLPFYLSSCPFLSPATFPQRQDASQGPGCRLSTQIPSSRRSPS
ncbi:hypothetical protein Pmani_033701 [Petrolisthes manimaculis]|uniref:Uncharacterized protein n=1 Tax=Petrolisthes manimaculis TaxID=1843537 RepID=A0AAE1TSF5_9EUCA|nr:hypothetical protein Pmani_033701 [Petrolisthes manimaculis]